MHFVVSGVSGRTFYSNVDPSATGFFVVGHPTLGDWSLVPALYKRSDGGPLHVFPGITPDPMLSVPAPPDDFGFADFGTVGYFAALQTVEFFVHGKFKKYLNGTDREGGHFLAIAFSGSDADDFLDSLKPLAIAWDGRSQTWSQAPAKYKKDDGSPVVDPDLAVEIATVDSQ
jgi:hypothetical protein